MAQKKVADLLVEVLADAGVRRIYGVSGDSLNGITDSIRATNSLQWIHLRPEEVTAFAEGAGLLGLRAETPDQVEPMIAQALKHDGPALVEVLVSRQELSIQPTITLEQAKGFSLFMLKAVLSGRGNEIIDLARVNSFDDR